MNYKIGEKYLITTDGWFQAPDGQAYKSIHGTIKGIFSDSETLGIKTNRGSTNWYIEIGAMFIAGCQVHYAVKCDKCSKKPYMREEAFNGAVTSTPVLTRTYFTE